MKPTPFIVRVTNALQAENAKNLPLLCGSAKIGMGTQPQFHKKVAA